MVIGIAHQDDIIGIVADGEHYRKSLYWDFCAFIFS